MQQVFDFFFGLGYWGWFILAVILFVLETIVPGVHFVWFGVSAAIVGVAIIVAGDFLSWQLQLIVFAILAVSSVFVFRRYSDPQSTKSDLPDLNVRGAQYIGRQVTVAEAIKSGRGKVKVSDTIWHARGPDLPVGAKVKVVGVDGTALVVENEFED